MSKYWALIIVEINEGGNLRNKQVRKVPKEEDMLHKYLLQDILIKINHNNMAAIDQLTLKLFLFIIVFRKKH